MRVKVLRGDDEATVLLVHPATQEEYARALDTLGRAGCRPAGGCGVVTTAEQRTRWELPDLAAFGRAPLVDSAQAFALLAGPAEPETSCEPSAGPAAEAASQRSGQDGGPAPAAVRALAARGAEVDQALATLDDASLPAGVRQTLRRRVREAIASRSDAVSAALDRAEKALALPWRTSEPQGFDPRRLQRALDHSHGALAQVKTRIRDVLAACPQTRALLTVERPGRGPMAAAGAPLALAVRPGPPEAPGSVLCLAGPAGTGKSSLAEAVARALGRTHVRATLEGANAQRLIRGSEGAAAGRIVEGLFEAGVNNRSSSSRPSTASNPTPPGRCSTCSTPRAGPPSATRTSMSRSTCPRSCGSSRRPTRAPSPSRCGSTSPWSSCRPAPRRRSWRSRNSTC